MEPDPHIKSLGTSARHSKMMFYKYDLGLYVQGQCHRPRQMVNLFPKQTFHILCLISFYMAQMFTITGPYVSYMTQVCMSKIKVTGQGEVENLF